MATTPNLGLVAWDLGTEDFNHSQLANNWELIDIHNHEGKLENAIWSSAVHEQAELESFEFKKEHGLPIVTASIYPKSIWRYHLADGAVGHKQIGQGAIKGENLEKGAIGPEQLGLESVEDKHIKKETITVDKFEPNLIPLGYVALFYRPSGSGNTPGGIWEICEGQAWSSVAGNKMGTGGSELKTGNMPNLVKAFARGGKLTEIGNTGGSATSALAHTHTVNAHSHTVSAHEHGLTNHTHSITGDTHNHKFGPGLFGLFYDLFVKVIKYTQVAEKSEVFALTTSLSPGQEIEGEEGKHPTFPSSEYTHSHGGATGLSGGGNTEASSPGTSAVGLTSNSALEAVNTEPPYVDFVYMMRVR